MTNRWTGRGRVCAVIAVLALVAGVLATVGEAAEPKKVKVGAVFSLTGPFVTFGIPSANAVKQAVAEVNEAGGLTIGQDKYLVDLVLLDDTGVPTQSVAHVLRLITKDNVKFIIGPVVSVVGMPTVQVTQQHKVIQMTAMTQIEPLLGTPGHEFLFKTINNEFGSGGRAIRYAKFLADLAKQTNVRRVAMLIANDDYGTNVLQAYQKELSGHGLEIVSVERYDFKATDLYPILNRIKTTRPDAVFWCGSDITGKLILKQGLEVGLTKKYFTCTGPSIAPGLEFKDRLELYTVPVINRPMDMADPKIARWAANYKRILGSDPPPSAVTGFWFYDPAKVLFRAMEKAGTTEDLVKIRDALRGFVYTDGLMKTSVDDKNLFHHEFSIELMREGGAISYTSVPLD